MLIAQGLLALSSESGVLGIVQPVAVATVVGAVGILQRGLVSMAVSVNGGSNRVHGGSS